ncbi:MAG: hypothetical protein NVSMB6_12930 [Burkholderiaceae bacterium]
MTSFKSLSRQDLTRLACDALASQGRKPSIGLVREWTIAHAGAKKGSDGDVQKDITSWFDDLLKLKRDKAVAGLPDAVSALARDFWRLAVDTADTTLTQEREALAAEKNNAEKLVALAQEDTGAAVEIAHQLQGKLALANETISGRDDAIRRLEASLLESRAALAVKDERTAGLAAELARQAQQHAAGMAELDGVRKHSLLQIDQARAELRQSTSAFARAEHEHKKALDIYQDRTSMLGAEVAAARGRLSAVEEALTAAMTRAKDMELALANAQARESAAVSVPKVRLGAAKLRAGVAEGRRRRR